MEISISDKIALLKRARNNLLRKQKKNINVDQELAAVCERIKHYRSLDKARRKIKKMFDK